MIKSSLKNYFKNLPYLFVPMGIIYLFAVFSAVMLVERTVNAAGVMLDGFVELFSSTVNNASGIVGDYFDYAFSQIDWNGNFFDTVSEVVNTDWVRTTVVGFLETLDVTVADFGDKAQALVGDFVGAIRTRIIAAVVVIVLAVAIAGFVTRKVLRRANAKRGFLKMIVAWLFETIIVTAVTVLAVYLSARFTFALPATVTVYVIITCFLSLLGAWVVHGRKSLRIGEIVDAKNILTYFLSSVLVWLIAIAAVALVWLVFGGLLAVLVAVPLAVYTGNIVDVNADSYVLSRAEEKDGAALDDPVQSEESNEAEPTEENTDSPGGESEE